MNRSRSHRLRSLMVVAATIAAIAGPGAVPAAGHGPDPIVGGDLWAQDQAVLFRWRSGAAPPSQIATAIRAAAGDANATRGARAATFTYDTGGASLIGYGDDAPCGVNGIACFDRSGAPASFTMWLREQGHVFDWGTMRWCQMYDEPPNGCYDAETIALDEFGHVQVLAHHANYSDDRDYLDAVVQTYSRTRPKAGWDMHEFGRCDVATLQRVYDVPKSTTPISTCLDLDTTLALKSSATALPFGSSVTLTATLRVVDDPAYDRLGGNPLSSRTVKLQRRAAGSTTWTTLATMAAGTSAGTYVASATITTTVEFRAVFSTPSSEGINGSTSSIVKVAMSGCTRACPQAQPPTSQ